MARHILRGLQRAAVVFHTTNAVRQQIEYYGLLDVSRLVQAPLGVSPLFFGEPERNEPALRPLAAWKGTPFLLHVGSCISRKRIDVLLNVFAGVRLMHPSLHLLQVGGAWTAQQRQQIDRLGISSAVMQLSRQHRTVVAALYRRAALVLLTSEAEGFGLPLLEALASGAIVVASDIPTFREVGAEAVTYCSPGDVAMWVHTVNRLLERSDEAPHRCARLAHAAGYSWETHAQIILRAYRRLCAR
jgi:glycosyltransferase involved in cell wall biosynthesis